MEAAYINYFDKLDELASLEIVDGHIATVTNPKTGEHEETIFIIGRTSSEPPVFYFRSAVLDEMNDQFRAWIPWEKIDLTIPAQSVTALYVLNRLYIFWVETTEKKDSKKDGMTKVTKDGTVKYSYQKVSGRWLQPQVYPDESESLKASWNDGQLEKTCPITPLPVPYSQSATNLEVQADWSVKLQPSDWDIEASQNVDDVGTTESLKKVPTRKILALDPVLVTKTSGWLALDNPGLTNKDVSKVVVTPDGRTLFAGTSGGGVFRCDVADAPSAKWKSLDDAGLTNKSVVTLAVTPDGLTLFAGTEMGVFRAVPHLTSMISTDHDEFLVRSLERSTTLGSDAPQATEYKVQRLTTHAVHRLRQKVMTGGLDSLLSIPAQRMCQPPTDRQPVASLLSLGKNPEDKTPRDQPIFDLGDPYAIYFREIFFHIPFLIADALNSNQQFEHARKWYHYILDPTRRRGESDDESGMWRYLPFRGHTMDKMKKELADEAHHDELAEDAFDPDAIAQTRLGAYEKAVAMKYLDNLIDWGDMLFAQDTWEAINHAVLLYCNALNLLGPKPKPELLPIRDAGAAKTMHGQSKNGKHHATSLTLASSANSSYKEPFDGVLADFCLPENDQFAEYWDRAQDCLYKIRHCMNIKGVVRELALFEPPIDPRQLIRAMASGQSLENFGASGTPAVPHYRFSVMLQQAKNLTGTVIQLGSALLSALEKKDGEDLNLLRSTQEQVILNMTRAIKEKQAEDGAKHLEALGHSLSAAEDRRDHYANLLKKPISDTEIASLVLEELAGAMHIASIPLNGIAVAGYLMPTVFGMSFGGFQPGQALTTAAQVAGSAAAALQTAGGMAATIAQFERRKEDWELQQKLAGHDVEQISAEIAAAEIRQKILERDLEIHDKSTEQARERDDFFRRKFSNSDLYQWMAGRLSTVYFQTYKLALELARSAERAYQYERNTDETTITPVYWDGLRKGLLAGEGLMLGLNQLEKAYMDDNERELEIEKTISLLQLNPQVLLDLKAKGSCEVKLDEQLFDYDFPGHYCRKIKSIAITIPAVVGPYQNLHATLRQTTNRVLLKPDKDGVAALIPGDKSPTPTLPSSIRSDWRPQQQIALSKGVNDSGLFELNFHDERYLPFEGTGAVSDWELELPKPTTPNLDFASISDVIIHLRYTALDGGEKFKQEVVTELTKNAKEKT